MVGVDRKGLLTGLLLAGFVVVFRCSIASAAYLESDNGSTEPPQDAVRPPIIFPVPHPRPGGDAVRDLARRVNVGSPVSYRNLTIFPLLLVQPSRQMDIRTLDEALANDWIVVRERDDAQVSQILVSNVSGHFVFLMTGEIAVGGKQNRIVRDDVLLGPHSGFVAVPVYCGEKDRWAPSYGDFGAAEHIAGGSLRRMAAKSEPQGAIWQEIDGRMKRAGVSSSTRNYSEIYRDRRVHDQLEACVGRFRRFCRPRTVGAVVVSGNRIVSCDLFSDADMLSRLWNKICRSYAMETIGHPAGWKHRGRPVDEHDVRRFLNRVMSAEFTHQSTAGLGQLMKIRGTLDGSALIWQNTVVHTVLFPVVPGVE